MTDLFELFCGLGPITTPPGFPDTNHSTTWPPFMEPCPECGEEFETAAQVRFNDDARVYEYTRLCPTCGPYTRQVKPLGEIL